MDTSGSLGYGIYYMGHQVAAPWPPLLQQRSIQWKELYPIALACHLWGHLWPRKKLLFHCDNQAVVDIWASGTSRDPLAMHLVRSIFSIAATDLFTVLVSHIVGTNNSIADSLSHLQISWFHPQISRDPLELHLALLQSQAIAASTRRSYLAGVRRYSTFSTSSGWQSFAALEHTPCVAAYLADQVSFKTIKLYMAAIPFTHIENSLSDPFQVAPLLHLLLREIKRSVGYSPRRRLPITMALPWRIKGQLATRTKISDLTEPYSGLILTLIA